ncbi:MAG: ABC transporter substrate-binding protein [Candidatus Rokubacteria bacterium]|nr:ABC transporter substrate-binding protein [Candidatus Rokubacteria bacterium]
MKAKGWLAVVVIAALVAALSVVAADAKHAIKVGGQCDRTGATKLVGVEICPAVTDYIRLVNKKGGVMGHTLEYTEIEHEYRVDRGVEAYERLKRDGAVAVLDYGTPIVYALTPRHMEDKIPAITPGFGRADSTDGEVWPYIFPMAASYWSQAAGALQYIKEKGAKKGTKIAYLYFDNPAGREGIPMMERVAKKEGYEIRLFAVPPPGLEMGPQVIDITRRMRADWVVGHLFGRSPSVSIKEFRKAGFPLDRVISLVWGAGEADVEAAGWDVSQGYLGLQFAAVGRNLPAIQEIIKMYRDEGKEVPKYVGGVYYNRGVLIGAILAEGIRLGLQFGEPLTGEKVKRGYEQIKNFTLGGFLPPLTVTPQDHEGGGWVRVYQVKGKEWVPVTDWIRGYRDEVFKLVNEANKKK